MLDRLKALWAKINSDVGELWEKNKIFLVIFGVVILIVKFREVLINILVSGGKTTMEEAHKKDEKLATQENQAKMDADKLVEQAKQEPNKENTVTADWNKK